MSRRFILAVALCSSTLLAGACGRAAAPPPPRRDVTFNRDVAPIVFTNCAPCHRPGEVAPFALLSYKDAVAHADDIATETFERHMPPWLPEPGPFPVIGERRLRQDHIDVIQQWAKGGLVEGAAADLPPAPIFPQGWQLGQPDLVLTVPRPFIVTPGKDDTYRNLVIKTALPKDVFVRAVEFKTGGAGIHHAVIRVDRTSTSRRRDGEDGRPGFEGMAWDNVRDPDGHFIGWAPGRGPILSPEGMPWRIDRGTDLVIEVHVMPSETPITVQPTLGVFLTETPPRQTPVTVRMGSKLIDIPAGDANYVVTDTYTLPVPIDLLSVYPHAHYLGKDMQFTATAPGGATTTLLHIRQWSFHWQQDYRFVTPIPLPAGTVLSMRYTYDNSTANTENPRKPPVRVRAGPKSTDEMADFALQVLTRSEADGVRLLREFDARDKQANVAMGEMLVRADPQVAAYQASLGGSYVENGQIAEAIVALETAVRLGDRTPGTENYLGVALMNQDRVADAVPHFQRAVARAPKDEVMRFNLGIALHAAGRVAESVAAYQQALIVNPDFPDAHSNLGDLFFAAGRVPDALTHFTRAVELRPESPANQNNLGSALAASRRYAEALTHVRRALELAPDYRPAQENLQRLQRMGIK